VALAIHDERLTRRVGAVVLFLAALTVVFVVMVLPRMEHAGVDVRIRFGDATGIAEGAAVKVAGRSIGHVRAIAIAPLGRGGGIVVEIRIDPAWADRIPVNSDFFIEARNPLAPRYVAIGPPPGHAEPARAIHDGDEVFGLDPPNLDRVLQRTWDNLNEVGAFLDALRPAIAKLDAASQRLEATVLKLEPRPGAFHALDARMNGAIAEARAVYTDLTNGHFDADRVRHMAASVDACAARIGAAITDTRVRIAQTRAAVELAISRGEHVDPAFRAEIGTLLDATDKALATAESLANNVSALARRAADGPGSIAAFGADLELSDDVKAMTKELKNAPWRVVAPPTP